MTPEPQPIRLRVGYKSPAALLAEFTRSVGAGTVSLQSRKPVPLGTRFVFELLAKGLDRPVEVFGEVLAVTPGADGQHLVHVRYDPSEDRANLDAIVQSIFESHKFESARKHPRVPLNLRGTEALPGAPHYLVRDLSLGGAGIEVDSDHLPDRIRSGEPFLLEVSLSIGTLILHGEIVRVFRPTPAQAALQHPGFGVRFGKLRPDTVERLERIIHLRALPPPPWKAQLAFGLDAVARMP